MTGDRAEFSFERGRGMSLDLAVIPTGSLAPKKLPPAVETEVVVKLPQLNISSSTVRLHNKVKDSFITKSNNTKFWSQMIGSRSNPVFIDSKILDLAFKASKKNKDLHKRKKILLSYKYGINPREKMVMLQESLGRQYINFTSTMMSDDLIDEDDIFQTRRRQLSATDINNVSTKDSYIGTAELISTSAELAMTDSLVGSISIDSTGLKTNSRCGERVVGSSCSLDEPNYTIKSPGSANLDLYVLREDAVSKTGLRSRHRPRTDSPGNTTIVDHLLDSYLCNDSVDIERFDDDDEDVGIPDERTRIMSASGMNDINDLVDSIMGDARIYKGIGSVSIQKSDISVAELDLDEMPDELLENWPVGNDGVIQSFSPNRNRSSMGSDISLLSHIGRLPPLESSPQKGPLKLGVRSVYDDDVDSCVDSVVRDEEYRLISQKPTTEYVTIKIDPDRYKKKNVVLEPSPVFLDGKGTIKPLSELDQLAVATNINDSYNNIISDIVSPGTKSISAHNSRGSDLSEEGEDVRENSIEYETFEEGVDGDYEDEEVIPQIDVKRLREEFKRQYLKALEMQAKVKLMAKVVSYEKPETKFEMSAAQRAKLIGDKNKEIDEQKRIKELKAKEKRRRKKKGKKSSEADQNKLKIVIAYCAGGPGSIGVSSSRKVSLVHLPLKNISKSILFEEDTSLRSFSPKKTKIC